jgi:rfaE bifunctional protein nucleotidyltransferase chain/domain
MPAHGAWHTQASAQCVSVYRQRLSEITFLQLEPPKILNVEQMRRIRDQMVTENKKLVFTNGCFDILHSGHVAYLTFARNQGDALAVGVNTDASVKRNKGDLRPICSEEDRAYVLASLRAVDYVVLFDEKEPRELIAQILPQVLVKGKDWAHYVSGRDVVEANGGKVVLADMVEGRSTTSTIDKIVQVYGNGARSSGR